MYQHLCRVLILYFKFPICGVEFIEKNEKERKAVLCKLYASMDQVLHHHNYCIQFWYINCYI